MKKNVCVALATIAIMSSCNNEDVATTTIEKRELRVETSIASATTRSIISSFATNAEVGLFITNGTIGNNYESQLADNNVKAKYTGAVWGLAPAVYLSNASATVYGYYPYSATASNGSTIPVESASQTDYLYGTHTTGQSAINNDNPTVNITMQHALALVQFRFNKSNYPGVGKLTKIEIANASGQTLLYSEGTMNCTNGTITNSVGKNTSTFIENAAGLITIPTVASSDETTFPKILVLPTLATTNGGDIYINFTIDGKVYKFNVPANTAWQKGTKNAYSVTISGTDIVVGNILISDWTSGVNGSAGLI